MRAFFQTVSQLALEPAQAQAVGAYEAAAGRRDQAVQVLQQALRMAAPEGYAHTFLDEGASMRSLIAECRGQIAHQGRGVADESVRRLLIYVDRLLAAFDGAEGRGLWAEGEASRDSAHSPQSAALIEPLSERECEVLRLMASGASNQAIAAALVISIGTVKSHINHILGKLAARNRTEAVACARALGLLAV